MSEISLIQFEDKDGNKISEVLQVPNSIDVSYLKSIINTTQDLYVNGNLIKSNLQNAIPSQVNDHEEIKKIRVSVDLPSAKPAFYCSSTFSGHEGPVLGTKFINDTLATIGGDRTLRFWDLITKTQTNILQNHNHWVLCVDANEKVVVTGGMDKMINIYTTTGEHIKTLSRHKDGVTSIKVINDKIVSCSRDKSVLVWDMDGNMVYSWMHLKPVRALGVTKDLVVSAGGSYLKVYKFDDSKKGLTYFCDLGGHTADINCVIVNERYIISGDDDGNIIVFKDFKVHKRLKHKREVMSLSFNPNMMSFASGSFDKTVKLWNLETGEIIANYFHVNHVYKVMVVNDLIISSSKDKTLKTFKISSGKVISDLVCDDEIYDFDYKDGHLVCGCRNKKVHFFN